MIIETIVDVAKAMYDLKSKFSALRKERRAEIADFFSDVSKTLHQVQETLAQGNVPHGQCRQMLSYAGNFERIVGDVLGQPESQEFAASLRDAHDAESLLTELSHYPGAAEQLAELERASGLYAGLATYVRVVR